MTKRTVQYDVMTFDELSEKAKERAREWYREFDCFSEREDITEDFKYKLKEMGYPTNDVRWRLNHCQGDGVAFYGTVDAEKVLSRLGLDKDPRLNREDDAPHIVISGNQYSRHYSHYNTMQVEVHNVPDDALADDIEKAVLADVKEVSRELTRDGYAAVDYYNSNEYVDSELVAGEWFFDDQGRINNH